MRRLHRTYELEEDSYKPRFWSASTFAYGIAAVSVKLGPPASQCFRLWTTSAAAYLKIMDTVEASLRDATVLDLLIAGRYHVLSLTRLVIHSRRQQSCVTVIEAHRCKLQKEIVMVGSSAHESRHLG